MKPQQRVQSQASSTGAKVFGLVVALCVSAAIIATTVKYVTVLFS